MSISVLCPSCGNNLKGPDRLAGKQVKCLRCSTSVTLADNSPHWTETTPATGKTTKRPAERRQVTAAMRAAFWLGVASLLLGLAAGMFCFFSRTAGYSRGLAWLGIVLGATAVVLAIIREECGFSFPFSGTAASLLSLALVAFWLNASPSPDQGMGGPPGGPPGGMGQGPPPDRRGGPAPDRGGPPRERGRGGPPAPPQ